MVTEKRGTLKCPICKTKDIVKYGKALRKSGKVQRWACNDCYSVFLYPIGLTRRGPGRPPKSVGKGRARVKQKKMF